MSSISLSPTASSLFSFLQPSSQTATTSSTTQALATGQTTANALSSPAQGPIAGHHHRRHSAGGASDQDFFSRIQQAVTAALQSAKAGGPKSDANDIVAGAIASVLKEASAKRSTTDVASDPSQEDQATGIDSRDLSDSTDDKTSFATTLASHGISAKQFQNDFLAAIQQTQTGLTGGSSKAFGSFPPGLAIDTQG